MIAVLIVLGLVVYAFCAGRRFQEQDAPALRKRGVIE